MAEIIVRVVEHDHSTPQTAYLHVGQYEVVTVQENGWAWSALELNNPDWRIIRISNVTAATLAYWADTYTLPDGSLEYKRGHRIDNTASQVQGIIDSWQIGIVNDISSGDRNKLINAVVDKRVP